MVANATRMFSHVLEVSQRTRLCRQEDDLREPERPYCTVCTCKTKLLVRLVRTRGRLHLAYPPARLPVLVQLCVAPVAAVSPRRTLSEPRFVGPPFYVLVTTPSTRDNLIELSADISALEARPSFAGLRTHRQSDSSSSATRAPYPLPPALATA